jgi:OOP family OmpA-OmpF porin
MKKSIFFLFFSISSFVFYGQNSSKSNDLDYNLWSLEASVGQNKAVRPFSPGYYSSNPTNFLNIGQPNHFNIGVRRMFNTKFGLKLDLAYDEIANQDGSGSQSFKSLQYRMGFSGIINVAHILNFQSFSNRFGLLGNAGVQIARFAPQIGENSNKVENNGGIIVGITPQFLINKWFAVNANFSVLSNVRQHFNWDGSYAPSDANLTGSMYNFSFGITYYIGKNEKHADWYSNSERVTTSYENDPKVRKRLDSIENALKDSDNDGVPDYLDLQQNTLPGLNVDAKGRFIDVNKNGVPDQMENQVEEDVNRKEEVQTDKTIAQNLLYELQYNIMYFEANRVDPNKLSRKNLIYIIDFLKKYPETNVNITAYTDDIGTKNRNATLALRRANNMKNLINKFGISNERIFVEPIDSNNSIQNLNNPEPYTQRVVLLIN